MGFFDKKTSTTTNLSETNYLIAGDAGQGGASVSGEGNTVTVNVTDGGSMDFVGKVLGGVESFVNEQSKAAFNTANAAVESANQSAAAAAAASARAMEQNAALAGQAIKENSALSLASQDNMARLSMESVRFGGDVMIAALSKAFGFGELAMSFAADNAVVTERATENALSFANDYSRSDQAQVMDTLIKWVAGAAAVAAVAWALRGAR